MSKGKRNPAKLIAVIGASGSGKTVWIRQQLQRGQPRRLIVWDPKPTSNYSDIGHVFTDRAALAEAALAAGARGELRAIFRPGTDMTKFHEKFDWLSRMVFSWKNCTFVAEELAHVTKAGWSPPGWLSVVTLGREEGLTVFGATQSPALCDKTFINNASLIHCGRLNSGSSKRYMADAIDCNAQEISALRDLEYIEKAESGEVRRGVVTF